MNRREFLQASAAGLTPIILGSKSVSAEELAKTLPNKNPINKKAGRPNVVVIVSDDHRWDVMSCMGNPYIKTPNLDRLANEGIVFNNAFACSGVCSPSRGSILGQRLGHGHCPDHSHPRLLPQPHLGVLRSRLQLVDQREDLLKLGHQSACGVICPHDCSA